MYTFVSFFAVTFQQIPTSQEAIACPIYNMTPQAYLHTLLPGSAAVLFEAIALAQ